VKIRVMRAAVCSMVVAISACGGGTSSDSKQIPDTSGANPPPVTAVDDGRHLTCDGYPQVDPLNGATVCEERDFNGLATGGDVHIETTSGQILARGSSRNTIDLKALVFAKGMTQQRAEAIAQQVVIHTDGDHFYATGPSDSLLPAPVNLTLGLESWWVSFEGALPSGLSLSASSVDDGVEAHNFTGDVSLNSTSGQVAASGLSGTVNLSASSADIDATDISGSVIVTSSSGTISLANPSGDVTVDTSGGDVNVDLGGSAWSGSGMTVATSSGAVVFKAPANYSAHFVFDSTSGTLSSDFGAQAQSSPGHEHLEQTTGGGGATIDVTTTSGDVDLQKQ
jgi:hypothetical protein